MWVIVFITLQWLKEAQDKAPNALKVFVGTKIDLRDEK